jgi:hypothetical protein
MFVGFPILEHATYSCPCQKHGSQCYHAVRKTSPRKDERGWEGRRRYHMNTGASDTDTHATLRVGSTVLSSHWRNISVKGWQRLIRRKNVLSLDSVRKEDGRSFDRFYVIIFINAMQVQFIIYFLPVSSGFHFYTHAFHSLSRIFYALRTVHITPVTSHQYMPHHW